MAYLNRRRMDKATPAGHDAGRSKEQEMCLYSTKSADVSASAEMWACSKEQARALIERANAMAIPQAINVADEFVRLTGRQPRTVCRNYAAGYGLRVVRGADGVCRLEVCA